jgi:heat shock protein HslJ
VGGSGGELTAEPLTNLEGREFILQSVDGDTPLGGTTIRIWFEDGVINFMDAQSTSAYALPAQPTLHFGEDGSLQIFTSCNTGEGTFAVNDGTLTLSDISITEEVCDDQNAATVDAHLKAVLATGEATFTIEATYLTVYRGELRFLAETE